MWYIPFKEALGIINSTSILAISMVGNPEKIALLKPLTELLWDKNQERRFLLVINSSPIQEVLIVKSLLLDTSPSNLLFPYKSIGSVKSFSLYKPVLPEKTQSVLMCISLQSSFLQIELNKCGNKELIFIDINGLLASWCF